MKTLYNCLLVLLALNMASCEKFLDAKPDEKLAIPSDKLEYLALALEDTYTMNQSYPGAGEIAADNIYIPDEQWNRLLQSQKTSANAYIWERDLFNDADRNDWSAPYQTVFNANLVLDNIDEARPAAGDLVQWNTVKGSALFFRACAFFQLLQEFAKAYDAGSAKQDAGIVLKRSAAIDEKLSRASVEESYRQVLADLQEAVDLLPRTPAFKTGPSKPAALALLARTYLVMKDYDKALESAQQCISLYPALLDYNTLDAEAAYPLKLYNEEVIFHSTLITYSAFSTTYGRVNPELYGQYAENDLRRVIFFRESGDDVFFKGSYNGSNTRFNGIAADEVYLIAAECYARTENAPDAMATLNALLEKRWKQGTFVPLTAENAETALNLVLRERRKELVFRNLRWSDLKRLNTEPALQITIIRVVNGKSYSLPPGDSRYLLSLPEKALEPGSIAQN